MNLAINVVYADSRQKADRDIAATGYTPKLKGYPRLLYRVSFRSAE